MRMRLWFECWLCCLYVCMPVCNICTWTSFCAIYSSKLDTGVFLSQFSHTTRTNCSNPLNRIKPDYEHLLGKSDYWRPFSNATLNYCCLATNDVKVVICTQFISRWRIRKSVSTELESERGREWEIETTSNSKLWHLSSLNTQPYINFSHILFPVVIVELAT